MNSDKTNFALLRAIDDPKAQNQVRELVIRAYTEHEQHPAEIASKRDGLPGALVSGRPEALGEGRTALYEGG